MRQHAAQGGDGVVVIFQLNGNVTLAVKPGRVVGRDLQFAVNDAERLVEQAVHHVSLRGGGEQIIVVRMAGDFGFEQFRAAREVGFLKIGGGGEHVATGFRWFRRARIFAGCVSGSRNASSARSGRRDIR